MRAIVDAVDSEYGNAKAWKLHWDRQLLKALGVAYRYNLHILHSFLPYYIYPLYYFKLKLNIIYLILYI